jgi:hypothetical protein
MIKSQHVHIHQFRPGGAMVDSAAMKQFEEQWGTYERLVSRNALSHREITAKLHATLATELAAPFSFLDIACGDARIVPEALRRVPVRLYLNLAPTGHRKRTSSHRIPFGLANPPVDA